jgi:hypothetical protein
LYSILMSLEPHLGHFPIETGLSRIAIEIKLSWNYK